VAKEGVGEIDTQDEAAVTRHFKSRAADGASEVQPAVHAARRKTRHGAARKLKSLHHPVRPVPALRQDFLPGRVVKKKILREELVGLVNGAHA
jgi:hypothetical protein